MDRFTKAEQEITSLSLAREREDREEALIHEVVTRIAAFVPNQTNAPQALWRAMEDTAAQVVALVRDHDAPDS